MTKKIFVFIFIFVLNQMNSQKLLKNNLFQDENSAITENKLSTAKQNVDKAYLAYDENNIEKAKYYIDQSQRQGIKTGDFYFLLGSYMYKIKEFKASKRYWKIAYKEGGCWECKEFLERLERKEKIDEIISNKVKGYLDKK